MKKVILKGTGNDRCEKQDEIACNNVYFLLFNKFDYLKNFIKNCWIQLFFYKSQNN